MFRASPRLPGDLRLDLKPLGAILAPWRIPDCPKCHFVTYSREIPQEELEKCRGLIASREYVDNLNRSTHFRGAILFQGLGKDHLVCAHMFLRASWQEEGTPELYLDCLNRSIGHLDSLTLRRSSA